MLIKNHYFTPSVDLKNYSLELEVVAKIPEALARRHQVIAFSLNGSKLNVAMKDPGNLVALEDLKISTKLEIIPYLADEKAISTWINEAYISLKTDYLVSRFEKRINTIDVKEGKKGQRSLLIESLEDEIPLVDHLLQKSILGHASDFHLEPLEDEARIRIRMDGQLRELQRLSKEALESMTTRIKALARLDITEKRKPQDGRFSMNLDGIIVDLRVSILPTIRGEKTVIRMIYKEENYLALENIGFFKDDYDKVKKLLRYSHGLILVTGPTGSGKSTTLSAALRSLNKEAINIVTVEDPVENKIEGINQINVQTKIGLDFAEVLRAILRQDPDVMMIGEMRDTETSQIAFRAAITGHLVLSTLHTYDAASAVTRLVDMGIEPYMVGAAVKGIIAQRLIRRLCPHCRERHSLSLEEARAYGLDKSHLIYKPKGCKLCHLTGYKGRFAVHEVLIMNDALEECVAKGELSRDKIKQYALASGMSTLKENVLHYVLDGETSLEEVDALTYGE